MGDTKTTKTSRAKVRTAPALVGGNMPDGSRFEKGEPITLDGLDAEILTSLVENNIIAKGTE